MACHKKERINFMLGQHTFDVRNVQSHNSTSFSLAMLT
jgi:hypothetical protein